MVSSVTSTEFLRQKMLGSEETSGLDASSQRVRWGRICGTAASLTLKNIMYLINTDVYLDFCKCIFTNSLCLR